MKERKRRRVNVASLLSAVAIALASCSNLPSGPANTSEMAVRGVTLVDWTANGYSSASAEVVGIEAAGANTLAILVTAYQVHSASDTIRSDTARTPTQSSVADVILQARSLTTPLRIAIKLHVDVDSGEWRGTISPPDAGRWFGSYGDFVLAWASLANQLQVEQLVVGTELAGTLQHEDRWRKLIEDVRAIYSGEIVYAASWDESFVVPFWDMVDVVGVNFYAPVAARDNPGRVEVLANWQPWLARLQLLHKQAKRDVLLTELGYRSVDGAGQHPYDFERDAAIDLDEQADLYWAALQALGDQPWIQGVYWWNWLARRAGDAELDDYIPAGKPAEKELSDAWRL